jgi:hypothetical protein
MGRWYLGVSGRGGGYQELCLELMGKLLWPVWSGTGFFIPFLISFVSGYADVLIV